MADTLLMDAPGTIAAEGQDASVETPEETQPPEAVDSAGAPEATDSEPAAEAEPEDPRAEVERLRKELEAEKYRRDQALKDQKAQIEREANESAQKARYDAERATANATLSGEYAANVQAIIEAVGRGDHLDENGIERRVGNKPITQAWIEQRAGELANAIRLNEVATFAAATPRALQAEYPDWKPDGGLLMALETAARARDTAAIWQAQHALHKAALLSDLEPKTRKQVEAELAEAMKAAEVESAAKTRASAPRATNPTGGVASGVPSDWRERFHPLSKEYRDAFRQANGYDAPSP